MVLTGAAKCTMPRVGNQSASETARHPDHFVAEWRVYRGLSQAQLGEMVDASHSKISRIESGETELKSSFLKKLARIFNIPPVAVLTINPMGEGRKTAEMLDVWQAIEPGKRDDALRVLRAFTSNGTGTKAS